MRGKLIATLRPHNCPRYPHCSAAICPLDLDWRQRIHKEDEEVCHLLRISQKDKAEAFFATYFEPGILEALRELLPIILKHYPSLAKGIGVNEDRPLRKPYKPKDYRKPKAKVLLPEAYEAAMEEWLRGASGGPTSDLNRGVGTLAYPENVIHE